MKTMQLWLVATLVAGAVAGPILVRDISDATMCARRCTGSNKFKFTPGMTYEFEYNVKSETTMEGADADRASIEIQAVADIEVLSQCDFALRLRDVSVFDTSSPTRRNMDLTRVFQSALERDTLRFSYQDGVVEDVCPTDDEVTWALNFKRGVLSSIQNSMDNLEKDQIVHETDVTGKCNTNYKVINRGWYSTTIKKSKDLIGCTDRHGYRTALQATPYRVPSNIQSLPLLKSTHECEQTLDKTGRLRTTLCSESHIFRPFSRENSGAVTKVTQKLNFKHERHGVSAKQGYIGKRATIHFEHAYGQPSFDKTKQDAVSKLEEICSATRQDIRPDVPEMFSQLVYIMKNLDISSMRGIYSQITAKTICRDNIKSRKFFLDALPMTGTDASVRMMKELLLTKAITGTEADMWIASLAFIQTPTAEMLVAAKELLESSLTSEQALLPVSTMVHNYCNQKTLCEMDRAVSNIISTLERNIGPGCYVPESKLDKILRTLRALGNIGHVQSVSSILSTCFLRSSNTDEVRVAAIDAYRRLPCSVDRSDVLSLYEDKSQDSELRIKAYIVVMQCPSQSILRTVQRTLEMERANQVGSFVWSHLTNLMESSSPHKQGIRGILENEELKKEFDLEKIKYSRNYEGSFFLEKFNTGAMVESNLIWSGKSFIPRSAMVNLTVDLFGNSMNLFEMGGRVEGLEYLLETYLGPYGYFGNKKGASKGSAGLDQIRASMYMRMFGNEMTFMHMTGVDSLQSLKNFRFVDILNKVSSSYDHHFTQSVMFIDSSVIVPTTSGLPLNLTVNGTATVDLKVVGTVNLKKLTSSPSSILIDGEFQPSGSVQMTGIMSVDAYVTKIGMKVVNTWHSSTATRGRIELNRGKMLSVELQMPEEKMEILDVKTAFFSLNGDSVREQKLLDGERKTIKMCSGSRIASVTGVEVCSEFNYVNASMRDDAPYFPFTGPLSFELALFKRDTHKTYKLLVKRTATSASSIAQLALNTPGSRVNRNLGLDFEMNYKRKQFEVSITSPWKKMTAKGHAQTSKNLWALGGSLFLDETREYSVNSEMKFNKEKDSVTYRPRVQVVGPKTNIVLSGQLITEKNKMADMEMSLTGVRKHPMIWKGTAMSSKSEKNIKTSFSLDPKRDYSLSAGLVHETSNKRASFKFAPSLKIQTPTSDVITFAGYAEYKNGKSFKGDVMLAADDFLVKPVRASCVLKQSSGKRAKYTGTFSLKSRSVNAKATGIIDCKSSGTSTRILVDYNIRKLTKNRITFNSKYTDRSTKSLMKYKLTANMDTRETPELNFHTAVDLTHSKTNTEASLDFVYGKSIKTDDNKIASSVIVNHQINSRAASVDYNLRAYYQPLGIDAQLKGKHKHDSKYLTSSMHYTNGKTTKVSAGLNLKDETKDLLRMSGDFSLGYSGKDISISSELNQKSKRQLYHDITWKIGKMKSSIFTKYQQSKDSSHKFSTDIHMSSQRPIKISGSTDIDYKNFKAVGKVLNGDDEYGLRTSYKYTDEPRGKWSLGITHPEREITVDVNGGKQGKWYEGQIDAKWDAGRNNKDRMVLDGRLQWDALNLVDGSLALKYPSRAIEMNVRHTGGSKCTTHAALSWSPRERINFNSSISMDMNPASRNLEIGFQLQTPFTLVKKVRAEIDFIDNSRVFMSKASYSHNEKQNQISTNLNINKPFSLRNVDITSTTRTTWNVFRKIKLQITHRIDAKLMTKVKGSLDNTNIDVAVTAENKGTSSRRNVEASVALKSNIPEYEYAGLRIAHNDDSRKFVTDIVADYNGRQWIYDLDMSHYRYGWQLQNNGKLTFSTPYTKMVNIWQQRITAGDIKSTFTSEWGRGQMIKFDFAGTMDDASEKIKINSNVLLQTPWMPVREFEFQSSDEYGPGFLHSSYQLNLNRQQKWHSLFNMVHSSGQIDFDMNINSPYSDEITGKINSRYNRYPVTAHADVTWSPENRISADVVGNIRSLSSFGGNIRIATPFTNAETFVLQVAQKKEGSEYISTGSVQFGFRENIEMETRVRMDSSKRVWTKIYTSFEDYKDIEAGIEFSGNYQMFSGKTELSIKPVFGTLSGVVSYDWRSDLDAKVRVDTPFTEFPYLQVRVASDETSKGSHFLVESVYSPRKTITLDVTYNVNGPYYLNANAQSPFENMERASILLRHATGYKAMESYSEATYGADSKITGEMKLKWDRDLDGTITINTPFNGYEYNKITAHHEGDLNDFKCHGEIQMYGDNIIDADITFQNGHRKSGYVVVSSSLFDRVKAKFSTRGDMTNFKSSTSVSYGYKKLLNMQLQNKISSRRLNTAMAVKTPYTEDLDIAIEHEGDKRRFSTKATGSLGANRITTETSLIWIDSSIDFTTSLQYMINAYDKHLALSIHNKGNWDNFSTTILGQMDSDQVDVRGSFSNMNGIEGKLAIQTPVDNFRETGVNFRHMGDLSSFTSQGQVTYMDGKEIRGSIKFVYPDIKNVEARVEIQTPFHYYENIVYEHRHHTENDVVTSNTEVGYGYNKKITSDIRVQMNPVNMNVVVKTPFTGYETTRAVHSHEGPWNRFKSHSEIEVGSMNVETDTTFNHGRRTDGNVVIKSNIERLGDARITFRSNNNLKNLEAMASAYMNGRNFEAEAINQLTEGRLLTTISAKYPYNHKLTLHIDHRGRLSNFNTRGSVTWGSKSINAEASFQNQPSIHGTFTVHTPFEHFKETGFAIKHNGDYNKFDFDGAVNYMDGKSVETNIQHSMSGFGPYSYGEKSLTTAVNVKTPFTDLIALKLDHHNEDSNVNTVGTATHGDKTVNVVFKCRNGDASVKINTPFQDFRDIGASGRFSGDINKFTTEGHVQYMDGKSIDGTVSGSLIAANNIDFNIDVQTPFAGLEQTVIKHRHNIHRNAFALTTELRCSHHERMMADITGTFAPNTKLTAVVKTPFTGYEHNQLTVSHEGGDGLYKTNMQVDTAGKTGSFETIINHAQTKTGSLLVNTNIDGYENIRATYTASGDLTDFRINAQASLNDKTVESDISNRFLRQHLATAVVIKTPFSDDIEINLAHNGRSSGFSCKASASIKRDIHGSFSTTYSNRGNVIKAESDVEYMFANNGNRASIKIVKEGTINDLNLSARARVNRKTFEITNILKITDDVHGEVTIKTPYRPYKNVGLTFDHTGSLNQFRSEGLIKYMDDKQISGRINHYNYNWQRIESDIEINTPVTGYELTKVEVRHNLLDNTMKCNAGVQYGRAQEITGDMTVSMEPFDFAFKATTPFSGYEQMSAEARYSGKSDVYELDGNVAVGPENQFTIKSSLDLAASPMKASVKISTPFSNLDTAVLTITHSGQMPRFRSTLSFYCPCTGQTDGRISLFYLTPFNLKSNLMLTSDIKHLENIKFALKVDERSDSKTISSEVSWTPEKQVTMESSWKQTNGWNGKQYAAEIVMTSPYSVMRQGSMKVEHEYSSDKYTGKIQADLNGETVVDADMDYAISARHEASINMRKPKPMHLTLSSSKADDNNIDSDLYVNWDRDEPDSNIRFQTVYNDNSGSHNTAKDLKLKVIHPSRTVGIVGSVVNTPRHTKSRGELIWGDDQAQKLTYDFSLNDRSRRYSQMYDGNLKFGLPVRSVQMSGSYSDDSKTKTVDGSFFWDADRDQSKEIGMKAILSPNDAKKTADFTLRLPSIGKDVKLGTEVMLNEGRTLFNGKTSFSYSPDTRKTLTLLSKLEDLSSYGSKNYSLVLAVTHPYTDVNAQLKSHIGWSSEKYSTNMDVSYLTARRDSKNMALRAEIDRLRQQINLEMRSPESLLEITGKMTSSNPYQVRITNRIDNRDELVTDFKVDTERRSLEFQTNYDMENPRNIFHFEGRYLNDSAVQAVAYHQENYRRIDDSIFAVRLNTSRLLHTRVHWRPNILADLQDFMTRQVLTYGGKTVNTLHEMSNSFGVELDGKYRRITSHISEEARPLVDALATELEFVERQLEKVMIDVRRMHYRNDFYLQDLGQTYWNIIGSYKNMITAYKDLSRDAIARMVKSLEDMKSYSVLEEYRQVVSKMVNAIKESVENTVSQAVDTIATLDDHLKTARKNYRMNSEELSNKIIEYLQSVRDIPQVDTTHVQNYVTRLGNSFRASSIADSLTAGIYNVHGMVNSGLINIMDPEDIEHVKSLANNVYQEGRWAYNYWEVEQNVQKHLKSIFTMLVEMIQEELEHYESYLDILDRSRVIVMDPDHGEIQVEVYLPIPLSSLDTLPDVMPHLDRVRDSVNNYIPDRSTLQKYYEDYFPRSIWSSSRETIKDAWNKKLMNFNAVPRKNKTGRQMQVRRI